MEERVRHWVEAGSKELIQPPRSERILVGGRNPSRDSDNLNPRPKPEDMALGVEAGLFQSRSGVRKGR